VYAGVIIFEKATYRCKPVFGLKTFKEWFAWKKKYPYDNDLLCLTGKEESLYPFDIIFKTRDIKPSVYLFRVNKDSSVTQMYPLLDKLNPNSDVLKIKHLDADLTITSLLDLKEMYSTQVVTSFIGFTDITKKWLDGYRNYYAD
jgi:hypothetical protein